MSGPARTSEPSDAEQRGIRMAWESIDKWIVKGELATKEASDQRNGMVLAANQVSYLLFSRGYVHGLDGLLYETPSSRAHARTDMDHRELLKKFIAHVACVEGSHFTNMLNPEFSEHVHFNDEEVAELQSLAKEHVPLTPADYDEDGATK